MSRILLKTSGRTGSHLLLDKYEKQGYKVYFTATPDTKSLYEYGVTESIFPFKFDFIVQCHLKQLPVDTHNWDLVISTRDDVVAQICSSIISHQTNVWHGVAKMPNKIVVNKNIIKREVLRHVSYNTYMKYVCEHLPWNSVQKITMEELLKEDWQHLEHKKSINHKDAIDDYDNIKKYISTLQQRFYQLGVAYGKTEFDTRYGDRYDI